MVSISMRHPSKYSNNTKIKLDLASALMVSVRNRMRFSAKYLIPSKKSQHDYPAKKRNQSPVFSYRLYAYKRECI